MQRGIPVSLNNKTLSNELAKSSLKSQKLEYHTLFILFSPFNIILLSQSIWKLFQCESVHGFAKNQTTIAICIVSLPFEIYQ